MLSFKPTFSLSSFTFIKRLFSSSSLSAIRVVSSAYLRLLVSGVQIHPPPSKQKKGREEDHAIPLPATSSHYSPGKLVQVAVLESAWVQDVREEEAGLPTIYLTTVQIKDCLLAF